MKFQVVVVAKWGEIEVVVQTAFDQLVEAMPTDSVHVESVEHGVSTSVQKRYLREFAVAVHSLR